MGGVILDPCRVRYRSAEESFGALHAQSPCRGLRLGRGPALGSGQQLRLRLNGDGAEKKKNREWRVKMRMRKKNENEQ